MQVAVLGLGYVGLVSAACLAHLGHHVIGCDIDPRRIELLTCNTLPLFEPELDAMVAVHQARGRLVFTVDLAVALRGVDVVMLAVGTPAAADGNADLRAVLQSAHAIGQLVDHPATMVVKSTVPVGTCARLGDRMAAQLRARGMPSAVPVVSNPEFLCEGRAVRDFMQPDRIVVGVARLADAELLRALYAPLLDAGVPLLLVDTRSAELTKYAANVMLAARISLINELARIAEATGADIEQVARGVGLDSRIGPQFLRAGAGYGGSCFPKDVKGLAHEAQRLGVATPMLRAIDDVNERQKQRLFEKIAQHCGGPQHLRGKCVAVWGLAFKPGTDDMREAPSLELIRQLLAAGASVRAYDPLAVAAAAALLPVHEALRWCASAEVALAQADLLAIVTEWPEFVAADPAAVAAQLADRIVFDGRNALDAPRWSRRGLRIVQIGRPDHVAEAATAIGVASGSDGR
jgi:UDPglucose 6-dehydrogenase